MPKNYERLGALVQKGILLFAGSIAIPSPALVAAIVAGVVSKAKELRDRRVSEVLSHELSLQHVSYVEPDSGALQRFFAENPLYPELATEFEPELSSNDWQRLRQLYPYLYSILILERSIPSILFHKEIEKKQYRQLALQYEELSRGFDEIQPGSELDAKVQGYAQELAELINEIYESAKGELKTKQNQFVFDLLDYVREVARA